MREIRTSGSTRGGAFRSPELVIAGLFGEQEGAAFKEVGLVEGRLGILPAACSWAISGQAAS